MPTVTGKAGAVTLAAAAITGKITRWRLNYKSKNIETTGAGDTVVERVHLVKDWEADIEWNSPDQAAWDQHTALVGTSVAVTLKRKSTDAQPFVSTTGLIEDLELDAPSDGAITGKIHVVCNGTDLTVDTTPEA